MGQKKRKAKQEQSQDQSQDAICPKGSVVLAGL